MSYSFWKHICFTFVTDMVLFNLELDVERNMFPDKYATHSVITR